MKISKKRLVRRLRKKLRVSEFQRLGLVVHVDIPSSMIDDTMQSLEAVKAGRVTGYKFG